MSTFETPSEIQALTQIPFELKSNLVQLGREIAKQIQNRTLSREVLNSLFSNLEQTKTAVHAYKKSLQQFSSPKSVHFDTCTVRIHRCQQLVKTLQENCDEAGKRIDILSNRVYPSAFLQQLDGLQLRVQSLQQDLTSVEASLLNMEQIKITQNAPSSSDKDEHFQIVDARCVVPKNPPRILLDYNTHTSYESQLKYAIFRTENEDAIGAIARGIGGVGKTCALNDIGRLPCTKERFPGGVLYMSLGKDASLYTLIENLAVFVEIAGGKSVPKLIRQRNNDLNEAVKLTAQWFKAHICLFIIDDIWCLNGIQPSVITSLSRLAAHHFSRVAYSTRDKMIESSQQETVIFDKRSALESRKLLLHCSGFDHEPISQEAAKAFRNVLDRCDGLPIALNIVGGLVQGIKSETFENEKKWLLVESELDSLPAHQRRARNNNYTVKELLLASVRAIELERLQKVSSRRKIEKIQFSTTAERFKAFAVFQKRQSVPFDVLCKLWGTSAEETSSQVEAFERFSLLDIDYFYKGVMRKSIKIHDLILDVARDIGKNSATEASKRLIESYTNESCSNWPKEGIEVDNRSRNSGFQKMKRLFCSGKSKPRQQINVPSFADIWVSIDDDGFALVNLFHLLEIGCMESESLLLLENPQWIRKQFEVNGLAQLERDISVTLNQIDSSETIEQQTRETAKKFLDILRAAIVEGEMCFSDHPNPSMIYTQLYGRMMYFKENVFILRFLENIRETEKTWLRPSFGAMSVPNTSIRKTFRMGSPLYISCKARTVEMIVQNYNLIIVYEYNYENDKLKQIFNYRFETDDPVRQAVLTSDYKAIVYIHGNKAYWSQICTDKDDNFNPPEELETIGEEVRSVAISKNGRCVVVGTASGKIFVFEKNYGKWMYTSLEELNNWVSDIVISGDLQRMVCISHRIYVWDLTEGIWNCTELKTRGRPYWSIDMSSDGLSIAVGSSYGDIQVWSFCDRKWSKYELEGHDATVISVKFFSDRCAFVSASIDGRIRLWECNNNVWRCTKFMKTGLNIRISEIDRDKKWICVADNKAIRVWSYTENNSEQITFDGHEQPVYSLDISSDGKRLISNAVNSVIVWDYKRGTWIKSLLKRYDPFCDSVSSVAISGDGLRFAVSFVGGAIEASQYTYGKWVNEKVREGQVWRNLRTSLVMDFVGESIVCSDAETVQVWKEINGSWINHFTLNFSVIRLIFFASGNRFVLGRGSCVEDWEYKKDNWSCTKYEPNVELGETVVMRADGSQLQVRSLSESTQCKSYWRHQIDKENGLLTGWIKNVAEGTTRGIDFRRFDDKNNDFGPVFLEKPLIEKFHYTYLAYKSYVLHLEAPPYISFLVQE